LGLDIFGDIYRSNCQALDSAPMDRPILGDFRWGNMLFSHRCFLDQLTWYRVINDLSNSPPNQQKQQSADALFTALARAKVAPAATDCCFGR